MRMRVIVMRVIAMSRFGMSRLGVGSIGMGSIGMNRRCSARCHFQILLVSRLGISKKLRLEPAVPSLCSVGERAKPDIETFARLASLSRRFSGSV